MLATLLVALISHAQPDIAFVHFNVIPMTRKAVLKDQSVIVHDGVISRVGPSRSTLAPAGASIVDGHGTSFLLPGLTDMHTHLRYEEDLALYLANGVTTVRNMRGTDRHLNWRKRVHDGSLDGPRIYTAGPILGLDQGHVRLATPAEGDREVRMQKQEGYDAIKVYDELPGDVLKQVVKTAREVGIPVVGHVNTQLSVDGVLDLHQDSIEHAEQFAYHLHPTYDRSKIPALTAEIPRIARRTKQAGAWVCPTMAYIGDMTQVAIDARPLLERPEVAYLHPETYIFWATQTKPKESAIENRELDAFQDKLVFALNKAGAGLLVGTDSYIVGSVMGFAVHREMKRMARAGLTPYEVLRAATVNAGKFTHSGFGVVRPGASADLIVVAKNPLENLEALDRIEGVMNLGRWHPRTEIDALLSGIEAKYAPGLQFVKLALDGRTDEALAIYQASKKPIYDQERIFNYLGGVLTNRKREADAKRIEALSRPKTP